MDHQDKGLPYSNPRDNPFLKAHERDDTIRPEVWAIGFREPWRFSFDSLTGELWVGDVGQSKHEEVCLVKNGESHSWNAREGFEPFSDEYLREGEKFTDHSSHTNTAWDSPPNTANVMEMIPPLSNM